MSIARAVLFGRAVWARAPEAATLNPAAMPPANSLRRDSVGLHPHPQNNVMALLPYVSWAARWRRSDQAYAKPAHGEITPAASILRIARCRRDACSDVDLGLERSSDRPFI